MATAYAALVSLLNNLDLIQHHPLHSFSFENKQIESLLASVVFLIHFMETGDYHGGAAEDLERRIACAAHAAENVIESHVVDQISYGTTLGGKAKPSCFFLPDLQKAIEVMEFVRKEATKVPKSQSGFKAEQPTFSATNLTSQKNTMVGFDKALHRLVDLLTGEANGRRVIPIVGMGGIGKTTLARNAFQHKFIEEHFDVCLWATISQQYDVKAILSQLLSCVSEPTSGNVAELELRLYKWLYGRRYLIILDDMWSPDVWDVIKFYFPADEDNMSRIVVTSRQQDVADHLTSSPCFPLDLLDKDKSWDLFCENAFGEEDCPVELEAVGYKIVRKCKGLPLAIIVVGGHLRKSPRTLKYWKHVANHMDSILSSGENEEPCLDILSLSYNCLPVHLKPCFLYMGSFEEDETVRAATLVKLWIGEGFLKPSKTHSLEEVAEGYLKDLVDRNLIRACKRDLNGKVVSCEIHDIVRELCLNIVEKEEFLCVLDVPRAMHRERRVVIRGRLKFLRVLKKVEGSFIQNDFDHLNLRYLDCFIHKESEAPESFYLSPSISRLWNLQTLIFKPSLPSFTAPHEFWEMLQLRHLEIEGICLPDPLPSDDDRLVLANLQTLIGVTNFRLSEEVCKRVSNVKELRIEYTDWGLEYCPQNLCRLHKLESLSINFSKHPRWCDVAQSLTFPNSLKELSLSKSRLHWKELSTMVGSLPLLEVLNLSSNAAVGSEWNAVEGEFVCLKSLTIHKCRDLVHFNADGSHFLALRDLALSRVSKMDDLPSGIGEMASLHRISLKNCSVSLAVSAMRMLVELEQESGSEDLQLEVYFGFIYFLSRWEFRRIIRKEGLRSNNLKYR